MLIKGFHEKPEPAKNRSLRPGGQQVAGSNPVSPTFVEEFGAGIRALGTDAGGIGLCNELAFALMVGQVSSLFHFSLPAGAVANMSSPTRRQFLRSASLASAAVALPTHKLFAAGAGEKINLGIVGCGWRGGQLLNIFLQMSDVQVAGLCDVDSELLDMAGAKAPQAKKWTDMRDMFESPNIDAVVISTCNHWHCLAAIWAMEAGKHVYVEKPLGHTQWEGEQVIHASKKYQRICQVGTQQRSNPMQAEIKRLLHEEKAIGDIKSVRVNRFGVRETIGRRTTPLKPPKSVDYNLWLGPAQDLPIYRNKLHYDWHWIWNTGSGEIGNWGVHILDDVRNNAFQDKVAAPSAVTAAGGRFAWSDGGETSNVLFAQLDAGGIPVVVTLSNLPIDRLSKKPPEPSSGYIVYCDGGHLEGHRSGGAAFDASGKLIKKFEKRKGVSHQQNFIDAIRNDKPSLLVAPVQVGHDSTTWCNLINIAVRTQAATSSASAEALAGTFGNESPATILEQMRSVVSVNDPKQASAGLQLGPTLQFDTARNQFVGEHSASANKMLRREEYREPFVVPEVVLPKALKAAS